jgi:hypothetical protein
MKKYYFTGSLLSQGQALTTDFPYVMYSFIEEEMKAFRDAGLR